jgi:hypothetical protein
MTNDRRQMAENSVQMTVGRVQTTDWLVSDRPTLCATPLPITPRLATRNPHPETRTLPTMLCLLRHAPCLMPLTR